MTSSNGLKCKRCDCDVLPSRAVLTINSMAGGGLVCENLCDPCAEDVKQVVEAGKPSPVRQPSHVAPTAVTHGAAAPQSIQQAAGG